HRPVRHRFQMAGRAAGFARRLRRGPGRSTHPGISRLRHRRPPAALAPARSSLGDRSGRLYCREFPVAKFVVANRARGSPPVPADPRQRVRERRRAGSRVGYAEMPPPQPRASRLLTPQEIAAFVLMLPFWALLGQALWVFIAQPWPNEFSVFESPRAFRLLSF